MASIEKRGSRWSVWIRTPGMKSGKRRIALPPSIKSKTAAQAEAKRLQKQYDDATGPHAASRTPSDVAWVDFAGEFIARKHAAAPRGSRRNWIPNLTAFAARFTEFIGDVPIRSITEHHCRAYQASRLADGANASTLRKEVSFLAAVMAAAHKERILPANPWADIRRPAEPPSRLHFVTADEFERLVRVAPPARRLRYTVLALTGCRQNEALRLRWQDVDFAAGTLRCPNSEKGQASSREAWRIVPLVARATVELRAHRGPGPDLIFPHHRNWVRELEKDCARAGARRHVINEFRHAFGTWCAFLNISAFYLKRWMGHASEKSTNRYINIAGGSPGTVPQGFPEIVTKLSPPAIEWQPSATTVDFASEGISDV